MKLKLSKFLHKFILFMALIPYQYSKYIKRLEISETRPSEEDKRKCKIESLVDV